MASHLPSTALHTTTSLYSVLFNLIVCPLPYPSGSMRMWMLFCSLLHSECPEEHLAGMGLNKHVLVSEPVHDSLPPFRTLQTRASQS